MNFKKMREIFSDCDPEIISLMEKAFLHISENDKEMAERDFNLLLLMKLLNEDFEIIRGEDSFCLGCKCISLSPSADIFVFIHELMHALHNFYKKGEVPGNFFVFLKNMENKVGNFVYLTEILNRKLKMSGSSSGIENSKEEYQCISSLLDIIDSLTKGKSFSSCLCYVGNNTKNSFKVTGFAGHGDEYFSNEIRCFMEIFACYVVIRNSKFNTKYLELLELVLEDIRLIDLLERFYKELANDCLVQVDMRKFGVQK